MRKILVVDDHPMIFRAVESLVREALPDVQVLNADSITKGLQLYRNHLNIRLVLLDLTLPDSRHTEGIAVLIEAFPTMPIVVYSGQNEDSVKRACLRSGAKEFLPKNGDPEKLFEVIGRFLDVPINQFKPTAVKPGVVLSARQADVLKFLLSGLTAREIGNLMNIGESTVKSHVKAIYRLTECHNRVELVNWYATAEQELSQTVSQERKKTDTVQ
jgi:DNA-binding NarL/FixJ family response regulator